jgi:hypothetical protein
MPIDRPRKSRKRTREIREQSRATGMSYTKAMRDNDRQQEPETLPYRVVDNLNRGWHPVGNGEYMVDYGGVRPGRPADPLPYRELEAQHGPVRPVVPPATSDTEELREALAGAGVKAAASVLVALYRTAVKFSRASSPGGLEGGSLRAGREGSWESAVLYSLAWTLGGDLDEKPKRFDEECVRPVINVLERWTLNPERYVEVAENLAFSFGQVADELGGWSKVADRYLQPGTRVGHDPDTIEAVRGYLMSQSSTRWVDDGTA